MTCLEIWNYRYCRSFGGSWDKLSYFLNTEYESEKFLKKSFKYNYVIVRDASFTSYSVPVTIIMAPNDSKPGEVILTLNEFQKFRPGSSNFFPDNDVFKTLRILDELIQKYKAFTATNDFSNYPHDPELNGHEAFHCKSCFSIMFPDKAEVKRYEIYSKLKDLTPRLAAFESKCPNCGTKREVWGLEAVHSTKEVVPLRPEITRTVGLLSTNSGTA